LTIVPTTWIAAFIRRALSNFVSTFAIVLVCLLSGVASAQDTAGQDQLRMLGQCNDCTFEQLDLSGRQMTGVDLGGSTFRNVNFTDAKLNISIFDNAMLENVSFDGATLSGASFSDATLVNVSFKGADLTAAVFEGVILEGTNIRSGRLCNTQMPNDLLATSDCD
jgi:uncharacterized protein YjbI with pentapeptide repeats